MNLSKNQEILFHLVSAEVKLSFAMCHSHTIKRRSLKTRKWLFNICLLKYLLENQLRLLVKQALENQQLWDFSIVSMTSTQVRFLLMAKISVKWKSMIFVLKLRLSHKTVYYSMILSCITLDMEESMTNVLNHFLMTQLKKKNSLPQSNQQLLGLRFMTS